MRIAICEDNREDAARLTSMIDINHVSSVYTKGRNLISDMEELSVRFDLYMLDIFLDDDINGIDLAAKIRSLDSEAILCFISSSEDFYREAYDLYAFQYLIKPVCRKDIEKLLEKAGGMVHKNKERSVSFVRYGKPYTIPYKDLLYIASQGHKLLYKCIDGTEYHSSGKLKEAEAGLDSDIFIRCHQSFIVNLYRVEDQVQNVFICGSEEIPISRPYLKEAKRKYRKVLFNSFD